MSRSASGVCAGPAIGDVNKMKRNTAAILALSAAMATASLLWLWAHTRVIEVRDGDGSNLLLVPDGLSGVYASGRFYHYRYEFPYSEEQFLNWMKAIGRTPEPIAGTLTAESIRTGSQVEIISGHLVDEMSHKGGHWIVFDAESRRVYGWYSAR